MAKYQLIIEADDEDDLVSGVSRLAELLVGEGGDDAVSTGEAKPRGRPRGGRKAAAETTAAVTQGTTASGAQAASTDLLPGSGSGQTATTAASPSSANLTRENMVAKISAAIEAIGAEELKAALAVETLPTQLSKMDPSQYEDVARAIDDAIAMRKSNPLS